MSSDLTLDEIIKIDRQIAKNRETVFFFVRNFASNAKDKTRKGIVAIILGGVIYFSNGQPSKAIDVRMPPAQMTKVQPSYKYDSKVQVADLITRKKDLIVYDSPKKILFLMYLTDPKISSNQQVLKIVRDLRGGSWGFVGTAAFLGLMILIFSMGEGFISNIPNPGWGLDRPNPFQPPTAEHRYPPAYDLLFPRRIVRGGL